MCRQNEEVGRENLFNESYNSSNVIRITEQINMNLERLLYLAVQGQKYECFYFYEINQLQDYYLREVRNRKVLNGVQNRPCQVKAMSRGGGNHL